MKQTPLAAPSLAPAPAPVAVRLPCPACDGVGHVDASHPDAGYHPDAFVAVERTRFGKISYRAVPCDRCDGTGEIAVCAHGHLCGVDNTAFCDACEEIAGKWDGPRCAHGMAHVCVVCDDVVADASPVAPTTCAPAVAPAGVPTAVAA